MRAVSAAPVITQNDIKNGYVLRYFVKDIQRGLVTEIDQSQLKFMINNPSYEVVTLRWIISGNANDIVLPDGTVLKGAKSQNEATIEYYSKKLSGLRRILRNPLQYFLGIMNTVAVPVPIILQENYEVTVPTTTTTTTTARPTELTRLEVGRLTAYSSVPVTDIAEPFVLANWDFTIGVGLSGGALGISSTSGLNAAFLKSSILDRADVAVQARFQGVAFAQEKSVGTCVRVGTSGINDSVLAAYPVRYTGTAARSLQERVGGVIVSIVTSEPVNYELSQIQTLAVAGDEAESTLNPAGVTDSLSGLTQLSSGRVGIFISRADNITVGTVCYDFTAVKSPFLTVNGMLPSWTVQVLDASENILASAVATEDSVIIDMRSTFVWNTARTLRILDETNTEVTSITPSTGVWGGDVWELS